MIAAGIADLQVYRAPHTGGTHSFTIDVGSVTTSTQIKIDDRVLLARSVPVDTSTPRTPTNATVSFGRGNEQITVVAKKPGQEFNDVRFQFRDRRSLGDRSPVAGADSIVELEVIREEESGRFNESVAD